MTSKDWLAMTKNCPAAQGFRCCINGEFCAEENCTFAYWFPNYRIPEKKEEKEKEEGK